MVNYLNIVYVLSLYPSITETFVAREIQELVNQGNKVSLCVLRPISDKINQEVIKVNGVDVYYFQFKFFSLLFVILKTMVFKSPIFFRSLFEAILSSIIQPKRTHHIFYFLISSLWFSNIKIMDDAQYIHCHFLHSECITSRWISKIMSIPYGFTAHIGLTRFSDYILSKVVKDATICVGDTNESISLIKSFGRDDVHLILNSIDPESIEFIPRKKIEFINILCVGSLIELKGFHIVIKACKKLEKQNIKFNCKIVGEGPERSNLENLRHKYGLNDMIQLPGAMSIDGLIAEYRKASIFIMPSISSKTGRDGLPTVIIEAMFSGLPVIGTNHAAIPEIIKQKQTGILVKPNNPTSIFNAINLLFNNNELYSNISMNAYKKINNERNLRNNCMLFSGVINELISDKRMDTI